ncbi:MAG TPA: ABC transporter permease [Gemmatimonadales bacterium]|nr:ABC transporter permease [Gemmatimonadales bacterium]
MPQPSLDVGDGIRLALDAMRANKLRSALTVLGVVIGVATVMAMASIVQGVRAQIFSAMDRAAPNTFYVIRYLASAPLNPDRLPYEVRIRPVVSREDAAALRRAPGIVYAGLWTRVFRRMEYGGERTQGLWIYGADDHYMDVLGGTLAGGRFFSRAELGGGHVAVLDTEAARRLFGRVDPLGQTVRIGGIAFRVIGLYQQPDNIFSPPGFEIGAIVPFETMRRGFTVDETNDLFIAVRAEPGIPMARAQDLAVAALRRARALRPGTPNTFDLLTQAQLLETIDKLTGVFFLVMIALSSVALMVGGIGVMAIMMVSVTDRTREIGLRKALGATRRAILWQFLVEAATLTLMGGLLGIALGLAAGEGVKYALRIQATVPLWSALLATGVSIAVGLVFGLYPANRAARMDPVEALRHE